jgi:uncharacterized RDD family membrane protein YckC
LPLLEYRQNIALYFAQHLILYEYAGFWIRVGATFIDVFLLSIILLPFHRYRHQLPLYLIPFSQGWQIYKAKTATFIDVFLLSIILLPLTMMVYGDLTWKREGLILGFADFLINYVLPFVATILFWLYKSATPGKMALNMKVVDVDTGEKLSVGQSIGRYFAYIPAMAILMIGIIWVVFDKRKQGWHDKLAKTVVIRKRKK